MKSKRKIKNLIVILILLVSSIFIYGGYQYWLASVEKASKEIVLDYSLSYLPKTEQVLEKVIPEEKVVSDPQIYISSNKLKQGDTLLVRVKDKAEVVSGELGTKKIDFFKSANGDWVALIGIDVKKEPGDYNLSINSLDDYFEKIEVVKRNFPITELFVSKELEEKGYTQSKIAENIAQKDNPSINQVLKLYTPTPYFNKPFTYPLDKIKMVGAYGSIRKKGEIVLQHLGVDLDAEVGAPVYAANDGEVSFTEDLINYGKTLIIDHGLGIYSLYLHLDKFDVVKGQKVKQDDIVAYTGNTGYSIAPHLHFSIKANGSSVDPLKFIKTTKEKW